MNELVWAAVLAATAVWALRPRPPVRRLDDATTGATVPSPSPAAPQRDDTARRRIAAGGPIRLVRHRTGRRGGGATIPLAHWCESLARAVRGGDNLYAALDRTPVPDGAVAAAERVRKRSAGHPDVGAPDPDTALVTAVVATCLEHGGPSAEPLDRAAGVLRSRAAERADRRVQSAQARLSAVVLTWLPVAMLCLLAATSTDVRHVVMSPIGVVLAVSGGTLNVLGWWWMRRVIDRASR